MLNKILRLFCPAVTLKSWGFQNSISFLQMFYFSLFPLFLYTDSEVIYRNSDGHVIKFNILTNETEIVLTNTTFVSKY